MSMWLCVDEDGSEWIYDPAPYRDGDSWSTAEYVYNHDALQKAVPKGTIKKLIGRELTWEDEPVEVTDIV